MTHRPSQELPYKQFRQHVEQWWGDGSGGSISMTTSGFGLPAQFGNGSDGAVSSTGNISLVSGSIKQYTTFSLNSGHTVGCTDAGPAVIAIFASERMTVDGTITMDARGGTTGVSYLTSYGGAGGAGGCSVSTLYQGENGWETLGIHGHLQNLAVGLPGSAVTSTQTLNFRLRQDQKDYSTVSWGAAGGKGGWYPTGNEPTRGYGGGVIIIFAQELAVTASGVIKANGGAGGMGTGNSGGSGGGGGGLIWIVTRLLTNQGTIQSNGGAGGPGAYAGGTGGAGLIVAETIPQ